MDHYPFTAIDHVQLAMPTGEEDRARAFYCTPLGMTELPKPQELVKRGGCWFGSGSVQLHLGTEADFRPTKRAHPGLRCADYDALIAHLRASTSRKTRVSPMSGAAMFAIRSGIGSSRSAKELF